MRRPARTTMCIWTMLAGATIGSAMAQDVPYGVGDWPEALGNHRARIRVEQPADAVWVHLPWRRRDAVPDRIDIIVIDGTTNQRIENVLRVNIQRQSGDLLFQPVTVPGEYFVYYLPFKTEGSWYFPTTVYLPPGNTAQPAWVSACQPQVERLRSGNTVDLPAARVLEFQAINAFHRFDPMEVVASGEETTRSWPLIPTDRICSFRRTASIRSACRTNCRCAGCAAARARPLSERPAAVSSTRGRSGCSRALNRWTKSRWSSAI